MESFTVQCTSCESRIRVRNPNMIGQIANCPKCGSMILIAAPQQISVPGGKPTDSLAMTRDALPAPAASQLNAPASSHPPEPDPFTDDPFRNDNATTAATQHSALNVDTLNIDALNFDELNIAPAVTNTSDQEDLFEGLPTSAWVPEPPAPPMASEADVSINNLLHKRQEAARKSKQIMLIVGLGSLSLVMALAALFMFLSWFAKPKASVALSTPANAKATSAKATDVIATDAVAPAMDETTSADATLGSSDALPGDQAAKLEPTSERATSDASDPAPPDEATKTETATSETANSQASPVVNAPSASDSAAAPLKSSAPLPRMGGSIAPSLDEVLSPTPDASSEAMVGDALPPGLQQFANLFTASLEPTLPDTTVPLTKAPEVAEEENRPDATAPTPDTLLPAVVDKKLSLGLAGLLIDKRPLSEVMTTLALLGELPVMADLDSLLAGGLVPNPEIEYRANTPVKMQDVFNSIEEQSGISFVPWENRVLFARSSDERLQSRIPATLPMDDLVSSPEESAALVQAIGEVLPELAAMQVESGQLKLNLDADNRLVWFQLARLLQTWRAARGITNSQAAQLVPSSAQLPAWPLEAMRQQVQIKIKQQLPAEPIVRSWQRLAAEAKVACWIDWYNITIAEVSLTQKRMTYSPGRSVEDLLQSYANQYRVTFAIDDDRALWVTTPEAHRYQPRLYLLPLGNKDQAQWEQELVELAPLNPADGQSMLKLVPTPDGQYLFVRACRPVLVQPE